MIQLQGTNCRVLVLSVVAGAPKGNVLGAQVPCTVLTGLLYVIGNLSLLWKFGDKVYKIAFWREQEKLINCPIEINAEGLHTPALVALGLSPTFQTPTHHPQGDCA
jgi:hypothetical protein